MKVLAIQSKGKNPANAKYKLLWQDALIDQGHEVTTIGKDCKFSPDGYDFILLLEDYNNSWIPPLKNVKKLKIFVSMDTHLNLVNHVNTTKEHKIDLVITNVKRHVKDFDCRCIYLPNACPTKLVKKLPIEKIVDVGFCGNIANRREWLEKLERDVKIKKDIMVIGDDMVKTINSYKIHWNRNISYDINCRTFETLGCGTFLITNETEYLKEIFTVDKHLVTYKDYGDCVEKIKYYLEKGRYKHIAESGHQWVLEQHTYNRRAQQLMDIINDKYDN